MDGIKGGDGATEAEWLIRRATIVDGSGGPGHVGDVAVDAGRIVAVGDLDGLQARRVIDAPGRVLAPGFIDVHCHAELALLGGRDQFALAAQGVTTVFMGNDGFAWAPLDRERLVAMRDYLRFAYGRPSLAWDWSSVAEFLALYRGATPTNVVPQTPYGALRLAVMGWETRPATPDEVRAIQKLAIPWFEAGAVSLCLGLEYQPQSWASTEELIAVSAWAAREYEAVYVAHQRGYGAKAHIGCPETFRISREAGIPVHISHLALFDEVLPLLNGEGESVDVTFDFYPYVAGSTHLVYHLPDWAQAGGVPAVLERLRDPQTRARILPAVEAGLSTNARVTISYTRSGRYEGRALADLVQESGRPLGEFVLDLIRDEEQEVLGVFHWGAAAGPAGEEIIRRTYRDRRQMVGSDGVYVGSRPHPRGFGTFARVLSRYVRETGTLGLERAIHKMTGMPAARFGLTDRGLVREGLAADLVLFDPAGVTDRATYEEPRQAPTGVDLVLVNGEAVWEAGKGTGRLPGRVVGRNGR